jgi:cation-transporting P-type ATPase I
MPATTAGFRVGRAALPANDGHDPARPVTRSAGGRGRRDARIVEALQAAGCVVGMTGDGTNDAAAIRLADVGIGVAAAGSSSSWSAADLILADAGVEHIHDALLEGWGLWHRVRDAVSILVGGNAGEVAFMVLGTALSRRAPIGVRQLLLVNMLTDMFPALATAVRTGPADSETGPSSAALGRCSPAPSRFAAAPPRSGPCSPGRSAGSPAGAAAPGAWAWPRWSGRSWDRRC